MTPIRLLIADDHCLFRQGLRRICEDADDCRVVAEASDGREAIVLAQQCKPDVIVMDINMPGMSGLQATQHITSQNPATAVIILGSHSCGWQAFEAIKAGARGYLLKDCDKGELLAAIHAVHRGKGLITSDLMAPFINEFRRISQRAPGDDGDHSDELTSSEIETLRLVATGADNKAIAERLSLSENTIAHHLRSIYQKLHVRNRTQAVLEALRRGWASLDSDE